MALALLKASITTGTGQEAVTKDYYFRGSEDVYGNSTISTATGITEADDDENDEPAYKVEELLRKGILIRLAATLSDDSSMRFYTTRPKLNTALELVGTAYDEGTIDSVRIPLKAVFY